MAFGFLEWLGVSIDLWANHWLYAAANDWHWWNYLTTGHSLSMLYINHGLWAFVPLAVLVSLGVSIALWAKS
jgi:hypothetical protein